MAIAIPQVVTEVSASGAQVIDGSLLFKDDNSEYLTFTPGSNGNKRTWTLSMWAKNSSPAVNTALFGDDGGSPNCYCYLMNGGGNELRFAAADGSGGDA